MTAGTKISMVIVDDHHYVQDSLRMAFDIWDDIDIVGTAGDCTDGILMCEQLRPHAVLVDMIMKDETGAVLIKALNKHSPAIPALVMSASSDENLIREALEAGAKGYIIKHQIYIDQLAAAIHAVTAGKWVFCEETYRAAQRCGTWEPHIVLEGRLE